MNRTSTKYLYLKKSARYGELNARLTGTQSDSKSGEICLKLNIQVPDEAFKNYIPEAKVEVPKDFSKKEINLRML